MMVRGLGRIGAWLLVFLSLQIQPAWANAGPSYWQGQPGSEVLAVAENCPVGVIDEHLLLDFGSAGERSWSAAGRVTASYRMENPTENELAVEMAFPLVTSLTGYAPEQVEVTVDGKPVPFELYLARSLDGTGDELQGEQLAVAFADILANLAVTPPPGEHFSPAEQGTLYTLRVRPTGEEPIYFAVEFNLDQAKTKMLINGFNRYGVDGTAATLAAWCGRPAELEIFVLGEQPDFVFKGYTDGQLAEETDRFSYTVTLEERELKPYLLQEAEARLQPWTKELSEQLYNLYAEALDSQLTNNRGLVHLDDLLAENYRERVMVLVFEVDFPPLATRELRVSYQGTATMDRRETRQPVYSFRYFLNPARYWQCFGRLQVEVITPEAAPYLIDSSIPLVREGERYYTATLTGLPEEDLQLVMYHQPQIDRWEPFYRWLDGGSRLLYFWWPLFLPVLLLGAIVVVLFKVFPRKP